MARYMSFADADERAATIRANKRRSRRALQKSADEAAKERQRMAGETQEAIEELRQRGQTQRKQSELDANAPLRDAQAGYYTAKGEEAEQETAFNQQIIDEYGIEGLIGGTPKKKAGDVAAPGLPTREEMDAQKVLDDNLADLSELDLEVATPNRAPVEDDYEPYTLGSEDYVSDRSDKSRLLRKKVGSYFYDTFIGGRRGR